MSASKSQNQAASAIGTPSVRHSKSNSNLSGISLDANSATTQDLLSAAVRLKGSKPKEVEETLADFKWIEAIRTADMNALSALVKKYQINPTHVSAYGTPLHLACSFASKSVVEYLLKVTPHFPINAQDSQGNTCLHLACKAGRRQIVDLLLKQPDIDDSVLNKDEKDCKDLCKTEGLIHIIDNFRKDFVNQKLQEVHSAAAAGDFATVQKIYQEPRVAKLVDINIPDPMSGDTVLHEASSQGNYEMVVWCLKQKADPLVRDKRGKLPAEKTKNDKIKTFLKGVLTQSTFGSSASASGNESIKMRGVLYKWTNYAGGYKKRWFVLEDGVLSYYRAQEDEPVSCRGSISLKVAKLWIDASDRNRFDIIGRGSVRYHLRAEHPMEAKRWVIALTETKQWLQDNEKFNIKVKGSADASKYESDADHDEISDRSFEVTHTMMPSTSFASIGELEEASQEVEHIYEDTFHATANSALACVHFQQELVQSLSHVSGGGGAAQSQLLGAFKKTSETLISTIKELIRLNETREVAFSKELLKEQNLNRVWEENLRALAVEHEKYQEEAAEEMEHLETIARIAKSDIQSADEEQDEFFDAQDEYSKDLLEASNQILPQADAFIVGGYWKDPPKDIRKFLPCINSDTKFEMSIWSILKNNIGKDLSKIALPVFFNEPLSMLQRLCEDMEYSCLLDIASARSDPLERIQFIAAFAMSNYSSTLNRTSKPFNPLLGETFEYVRKDLGFRYLAEQVSHHPPISACYCESDHYIFWQEASIDSKFWGKSFEIFPLGNCHVVIKKTNEHFSWKKVTTCANNLIMGKIWLDHYGDMVVKNHTTGDVCSLAFKPCGWRGKGQYEIEGSVKDKIGEKFYDIWGHWNDKLLSKPTIQATGRGSIISSGGTVLWKKNNLPADSEKMFHLTEFAVSLNDLANSLDSCVCPTDSRKRPDQRAMEK